MAENNKALIFKDGAVTGQPSFRRIPDTVRLDVGQGIMPANNADDLQIGSHLQFDLDANGVPQHKVYNAELLVNSVTADRIPTNESGYGKFYALDDTGSSSSTLYFLDDGGQSHYLQLDGLDTLEILADGAISVDFDPSKAPIRTLSTGSVTSGTLSFSTYMASLQAGRSLSLRIKNDLQEDLDLIFPVDNSDVQQWTWLGGTHPTALPAGQVAVLSLICYGTDEASILAAFSYDDSQQITGQGTPDYVAVFERDRDIRSVAMYFYEEDSNNNTEDGYEFNRVGLGKVFGPETDDQNAPTGLILPEVSLHVHSNKGAADEAILKLQNNDANFKFFAVDADPEAVVEGTLGDIASDSTNGKIYFKAADSGLNTGWRELNTGLETFDKATGSQLAVKQACYLLNDNGSPKVDQATADASSVENWKEARILGFVSRALDGSKVEVQTSGVFDSALFEGGLTAASVGKPAYLSLSSGKLTTDVSGLAEGDVVAEVGVISKYISSTQADVVIQPKAPVVL